MTESENLWIWNGFVFQYKPSIRYTGDECRKFYAKNVSLDGGYLSVENRNGDYHRAHLSVRSQFCMFDAFGTGQTYIEALEALFQHVNEIGFKPPHCTI